MRTLPGRLDELQWTEVNACLSRMEQEGRAVLEATLAAEQIVVRRWAELRYSLQGHEVRAAIPGGALGPEHVAAIRGAFETEYSAIYGRTPPGPTIEVVSWMVTCEGPRPDLHLPEAGGSADGGGDRGTSAALKGRRLVYMPGAAELVEVPVYDRYGLAASDTFDGPAIVEERESTVVVSADTRASIDNALNLVVEFV